MIHVSPRSHLRATHVYYHRAWLAKIRGADPALRATRINLRRLKLTLAVRRRDTLGTSPGVIRRPVNAQNATSGLLCPPVCGSGVPGLTPRRVTIPLRKSRIGNRPERVQRPICLSCRDGSKATSVDVSQLSVFLKAETARRPGRSGRRSAGPAGRAGGARRRSWAAWRGGRPPWWRRGQRPELAPRHVAQVVQVQPHAERLGGERGVLGRQVRQPLALHPLVQRVDLGAGAVVARFGRGASAAGWASTSLRPGVSGLQGLRESQTRRAALRRW